MKPSVPELLDAFERGKLSRRELLMAMTAALAAPAIASAQGGAQGRAGGDSAGRGGRGGRGQQAQRDTTPLVMPFQPTGWKTVWMDHFNYQCADHKVAAAFYCTLMGWKVRNDDGKSVTLDMGDIGSVVMRSGLAAPPPAAITDAGLGVARPQVRAVWDGFAWGIADFDAKKVEAELKKRGLNPVPDMRGDYQSFWVKDPHGFAVGITNGTKERRHKTPAVGKLPAPAPFAPTGWRTLYLDHISYEVPDSRKSAAFYQALLGWDVRPGNGQSSVRIGDGGSVGGAIIRGNAAERARARGGESAAALVPKSATGVDAAIGHISFGMENWDTERFRAEFKLRNVVYGNGEPRPDMTGQLLSFHVPDAMGWDLQIGNKIGDTTYGGR